ncbi:hypothetical protein IC617_10275 [Neiella sp. HB171785]|uniref:Sulfotransferase family protein n=1 Tax=Neiella litorisoli TaxID=2771431 RepID=A0A8J6QJ27_9GAMM|nr:hypothetical protein [Neiella litorisoli]MBD1389813.1 hypothetical protein [Neiella litorisoli]
MSAIAKSVVIHVGPPKTGSSAVQKWFCTNVDWLKKQGIYYPEHWLDENGISCGHARLLFDIPNKNELVFNDDKYRALLKEFYASGCHTLFLSSEAYYLQLGVLANKIPNASFLGYIRNPLELIESNYNQMIKRQGRLGQFVVPQKLRAEHLEMFLGFAEEFGRERLLLRFVDKSSYVGGTIVSDVASLLGFNATITEEVINTSYSFEALEVKRWLNQYQLGALEAHIDRALQRYQGTIEYSLVRPEYRQTLIVQAKEGVYESGYRLPVCDQQLHNLIKKIEEYDWAPYHPQELSEKEFVCIADYLAKELESKFAQLTYIVCIKNAAASKSVWKELILQRCPKASLIKVLFMTTLRSWIKPSRQLLSAVFNKPSKN